jgi:hypothetical protein
LSPLCSPSQLSPLQSTLLCHIKQMHCQCDVPTNIDLLLYTKAVQLHRSPFNAWPSGRLPVVSCMNRGASSAVSTVCSGQTSILHHVLSFVCNVHVFLLSIAIDPVYKC